MDASERKAGQIIIEWVDARDAADEAAIPNFGWGLKNADELPDDPRLVLLLRAIADSIETEGRT